MLGRVWYVTLIKDRRGNLMKDRSGKLVEGNSRQLLRGKEKICAGIGNFKGVLNTLLSIYFELVIL